MDIWKTKKYMWLYMACVILVGVVIGRYFYHAYLTGTPPRAVNGLMDLSGGDLKGGGTVRLDGQWEFYWQQLLKPADFRMQEKPSTADFIAVPAKWNNYKSDIIPAGVGYATYRLTIRLHEPGQQLAIKMPQVATAYNLYINGELLRSVGTVGQTPVQSKPGFLPQVVNFTSDSRDVELILQVSSFVFSESGIKTSLHFGSEEAIYKLRERQMGFELFILGTFLIMTFYHFGLYLLRSQDKPAFYFGLFCLLVVVWTMVTGETIIMEMFPALEWKLLMIIRLLSYYLAVPAAVSFIYHLYASDMPSKITDAIKAVGLIFSGSVVLLPARYSLLTIPWYDGFTILACLYVFIIMVRAVRDRKEGAVIFFLGTCILQVAVVNDILLTNGLISSREMITLGLFAFIFSQTMALSTRFSRAYASLESVTAELRHSNEKIAHIMESITDGFYALDKQGRFTYLNKEAERLWQKPQEQLLGKAIWEELPLEKESLAYILYQEMLDGMDSLHFEMFWDRLGIWLEVNAYPWQDGISVFVRDIQERKQAEEKIREYTKMLKEQVRLLDLDPDYTIERSLDGVISFWNHGAELGYNWTKEEAEGKVVYALLKTKFPQPLLEINTELMRHGRWMGELVQTRRDGCEVVVRSCWLLKRGVDGHPVGVLEFNKDITKQKNMEKEMERLDRLNLIGQMAAGISHEVRNPMTTVRGFLQLLAMKEHNIQNRDYYELMISELDRANAIITEYLSVARTKSTDLKLQDTNSILTSLQPLLEAEALKTGKDIVFNLQDVPELLLDGGEIRQLILNLCRNGLEAMSDMGKTLTITTYVQGEEVVLSVRDEGPGIAPEILSKIGMPFLTTKDSGTGLGLAVCYGIAARHRATIEVSTGPEGTTFLVKFARC